MDNVNKIIKNINYYYKNTINLKIKSRKYNK